MRVDKFLHAVRYYKTRSVATEQCRKNKVIVNKDFVKPSKEVMIGDRIFIKKGALQYEIEIIGIPDNRVGAKNVGLYILNKTPKSVIEDIKQRSKDQNYYREKGEGRPTKKDRRSLDDFFLTDNKEEKE